MVLYRSGEVKNAREERELYLAFKPEIDKARQEFAGQFMQTTPSMVDYYHRELVRTLANEDASLLGADYPGPLV